MGAGGLEKQEAFPLTRAIFTQGLKQACSVLLPPGWESPCKTSSSQQHPVLAKHSLKPELPRRPVNSQEEAQGPPATAGVTQQESVGCWQLQETSVVAVGPGPRSAVAPSARRTPSGLRWWVACQGPNAYTTAWETFQGSCGERGPGLRPHRHHKWAREQGTGLEVVDPGRFLVLPFPSSLSFGEGLNLSECHFLHL